MRPKSIRAEAITQNVTGYAARERATHDALRGYYHNTYGAEYQHWHYNQTFNDITYVRQVILRDGYLASV